MKTLEMPFYSAKVTIKRDSLLFKTPDFILCKVCQSCSIKTALYFFFPSALFCKANKVKENVIISLFVSPVLFFWNSSWIKRCAIDKNNEFAWILVEAGSGLQSFCRWFCPGEVSWIHS